MLQTTSSSLILPEAQYTVRHQHLITNNCLNRSKQATYEIIVINKQEEFETLYFTL